MFKFFARLLAKILGRAQDVPAEAFSTAVGFAVSGAITAPMEPLNETLKARFPYTKLSVGELQQLLNRREIDRQTFENELKKLGFSEERIAHLATLASYIPSVPDAVRFAVREAFNEEIAKKYGLDEAYPETLTEYGTAQGAREEDLKYYWRSHWELPSLTAGYEMYHRGIITLDELKTLLKSQDVMPFWAEKLIKLSETPFTRVDVRRMYQLGVLSFDEMVRSYMDLGYSHEKATRLAEFTMKDATEEERSLTKSEITTLYRGEAISREEATSFLETLGYPAEHIELLLSLEDFRKGKERLNRIKSVVEKRYLRGFIDANDVVVLLSREGIPAREIDELVKSWDIKREEKTGLPTKSELKRFFEKGIITMSKYKEYMKRLNYPEEVIEMYVKDLQKGEKEEK